jgi:hypothetical protein
MGAALPVKLIPPPYNTYKPGLNVTAWVPVMLMPPQ